MFLDNCLELFYKNFPIICAQFSVRSKTLGFFIFIQWMLKSFVVDTENN